MVGIVMLLGASIIMGAERYSDRLLAWLKDHQFFIDSPIIVFIFSLIILFPMVVAGTYLLTVGRRATRAQRFPPPGYRVIRDTPILQGPQGIRRGQLLQVMGLCLICCGALILFVIWKVFLFLASID